MLDIIKDFNTERLIKYLEKKDLKFKETYFKILQKEKIASFDFFELIKEKLCSISFILGLITRLIKFIESFSQKL